MYVLVKFCDDDGIVEKGPAGKAPFVFLTVCGIFPAEAGRHGTTGSRAVRALLVALSGWPDWWRRPSADEPCPVRSIAPGGGTMLTPGVGAGDVDMAALGPTDGGRVDGRSSTVGGHGGSDGGIRGGRRGYEVDRLLKLHNEK